MVAFATSPSQNLVSFISVRQVASSMRKHARGFDQPHCAPLKSNMHTKTKCTVSSSRHTKAKEIACVASKMLGGWSLLSKQGSKPQSLCFRNKYMQLCLVSLYEVGRFYVQLIADILLSCQTIPFQFCVCTWWFQCWRSQRRRFQPKIQAHSHSHFISIV